MVRYEWSLSLRKCKHGKRFFQPREDSRLDIFVAVAAKTRGTIRETETERRRWLPLRRSPPSPQGKKSHSAYERQGGGEGKAKMEAGEGGGEGGKRNTFFFFSPRHTHITRGLFLLTPSSAQIAIFSISIFSSLPLPPPPFL